MAYTNFAKLTDEQKTVWSMDFWKQARNYMFLNKFVGTSQDSLIQRITELRKSEKGARAVITLVADLVGDGIAGDRTLKGNEEAMKSFDQVIQLDQLRHANINEGRMSEQKSVVTFREQSRDKLAYWMADRIDQLAFLTLSNVAYSLTTAGVTRVGSDFPYLEFASDVQAGTANRTLRWDVATGLEANYASTDIEATDLPSWEMVVEAKAYAKDNYIRPIRTKDGIDYYHMFMTPQGMAKLKQDDSYLANLRSAGTRGASNDLFKGTDTVMVDGVAISEYRHVYHPSNWGAGSNLPGQRILFCGAQALAFADIGNAYWVEEGEDYENQQGISVGKIFGLLKPRFHSNYNNSVEDFGCITIDTAV